MCSFRAGLFLVLTFLALVLSSTTSFPTNTPFRRQALSPLFHARGGVVTTTAPLPPPTTVPHQVVGGVVPPAAPPAQANPMLKNPAENFANAVAVGTKKGLTGPLKTFLLGIMAGLEIGVGAAMATATLAGLPGMKELNPGLAKLLMGMVGLPCGLLMVLITGAELFTGNTALVSTAWFEKKVSTRHMMRNWFWSYSGNLVGSVLLALLCHVSGVYSGAMSTGIAAIGDAKGSLPWVTAFARGIGCNWLVCSAVWMSLASSDLVGKAVTCLMVITVFLALGLEHSVANMFIGPMAVLSGAKTSLATFFMNNLVPVTLGNIVGGVVMVALLQYLTYGSFANKAKPATA